MEREYIIPLRKEFLKVPSYKRTKKAVTAVRRFLKRHMKSEDIYLGKHLNEALWQRGIKNPPHKIAVQVKKQDDGKVIAWLKGKPMPDLTKKDDTKKEKSKIEQAVEKFTGGSKDKKATKKDSKKDDKKDSKVQDAEVVKEEKKPADKTAQKPVGQLPKTDDSKPEVKEPVKEHESSKDPKPPVQ